MPRKDGLRLRAIAVHADLLRHAVYAAICGEAWAQEQRKQVGM